MEHTHPQGLRLILRAEGKSCVLTHVPQEFSPAKQQQPRLCGGGGGLDFLTSMLHFPFGWVCVAVFFFIAFYSEPPPLPLQERPKFTN